MHILKPYLTLVFVLILNSSFAQNICFQIIDSISLEPIPYCNILFSNNKGLVSNHKGEFCINKQPTPTHQTIQISSISYKTKKLNIKDIVDNKITLSPNNYQLKPISIKWSDYKFYWRGNTFKHISSYKNLWKFCQTGLSVAPLKRKIGIIETIIIPIQNYGNKKVPFRLHIYQIDTNYTVGQELLPEDVYGILENMNKASIAIDVLKYQIKIPENGVFVAVEILSNMRSEEAQIGTGQKYSEKHNNQIAMTKAKYKHRKLLKLSAWKPNSYYIEHYPFTNVPGIYGELPAIKVKIRSVNSF